MVIEAKDVVLLLVGIVGSVVANYIYKYLEGSNLAAQRLKNGIISTDSLERLRSTKQCLFVAAKIYIFANIFCALSGAAWIFGNANYGITLIVLGTSSVLAIFLFWLSLRWLLRAQTGSDA